MPTMATLSFVPVSVIRRLRLSECMKRAAPPTKVSSTSTWLPLPPSFRIERSEEHTSELQSQSNLVCRLLLEKKKKNKTKTKKQITPDVKHAIEPKHTAILKV